MQEIEEWENVDRTILENEIVPAGRPAVFRGLLDDWPAVQAGKDSHSRVAGYFKKIESGAKINAMVAPPESGGRFFYSEDFQGFNFGSKAVSISAALDNFIAIADEPQPSAMALQAMHVPAVMPSFLTDNRMPLLDGKIEPRIWISNRSIVAPHFDNNHNVACVICGRRRFTVFPPEQARNLYIGPLIATPGGAPISTVDLRDPDLVKFPRFGDALASAQEAVLEPGDAVYIPILWWHGVESLDALNVLANYWWNNDVPAHRKPILALIHSMAILSELPLEQRAVWQTFFEHFVFQDEGDPGAHLPANLRDVMGDLSSADRDRVLAFVAERLLALVGKT